MESTNLHARLAAVRAPSAPGDDESFDWPPRDWHDQQTDVGEVTTDRTAITSPDPNPLGRASQTQNPTQLRTWIGERRNTTMIALAAIVAVQATVIVVQARRQAAVSVRDRQSVGTIGLTMPAVAAAPATHTAGAPAQAAFHPATPLRPTATTPPPTRTRLIVRSEARDAKVAVDGRSYGTAPATIAELAPGPHTVTVMSAAGTVTRSVDLESSATTSLLVAFDSSARPGWVSVSLPIEVQVFESGKLLGVSRSERIMMDAGTHTLELVNETLKYRDVRKLEIKPGEAVRLAPELPKGLLSVNALPWAEVFIDGERAGETPLGNLSLPIGTHEVAFRNPKFGNQTRTITVTGGAAARLSVDLRQ